MQINIFNKSTYFHDKNTKNRKKLHQHYKSHMESPHLIYSKVKKLKTVFSNIKNKAGMPIVVTSINTLLEVRARAFREEKIKASKQERKKGNYLFEDDTNLYVANPKDHPHQKFVKIAELQNCRTQTHTKSVVFL